MATEKKITRTTLLSATPADVWDALTNPEKTKQYMFNCAVSSDWQPGSPITWTGNYEGYESGEKGTILHAETAKQLKYTSIDPNFGIADTPENYLHITYDLAEKDGQTVLTTTLENFNSDPDRIVHVVQGWDNIVLPRLKKLVEKK